MPDKYKDLRKIIKEEYLKEYASEYLDTLDILNNDNIDLDKSITNLLNLKIKFYKTIFLEVSQILVLALGIDKFTNESSKLNNYFLFENEKEDDKKASANQNKITIIRNILDLIKKYVKVDVKNKSAIILGKKDVLEFESTDINRREITKLRSYFETSIGHIYETLASEIFEDKPYTVTQSYKNNVYHLYVFYMIKRNGSFTTNLNTFITKITSGGKDTTVFTEDSLKEFFFRNVDAGIIKMTDAIKRDSFDKDKLIAIKSEIINEIKKINPEYDDINKFKFIKHDNVGDIYDLDLKYENKLIYQIDIKSTRTDTPETQPTSVGVNDYRYRDTLKSADFIGYGILNIFHREDVTKEYLYVFDKYMGGGLTKGYIREKPDECFVAYNPQTKLTSNGTIRIPDLKQDKFAIKTSQDSNFFSIEDPKKSFDIKIKFNPKEPTEIEKFFQKNIIKNSEIKDKLGIKFNGKKYLFDIRIMAEEFKILFESLHTQGFESGSIAKQYVRNGLKCMQTSRDNFAIDNFYKIYNSLEDSELSKIKTNIENIYSYIEEIVSEYNNSQAQVSDSHNRTGSILSETLLRNIIKSLLKEADKKSYSGSHPEESYGWSAKEEDFMFDKPGLTTWEEDRQRVKEYLRSMGILAKDKKVQND